MKLILKNANDGINDQKWMIKEFEKNIKILKDAKSMVAKTEDFSRYYKQIIKLIDDDIRELNKDMNAEKQILERLIREKK